MGYEKTNWQTGDVVTAAKLNKIENELENISGPAPTVYWAWEGTPEKFVDMLDFEISIYTSSTYHMEVADIYAFITKGTKAFDTENTQLIGTRIGEQDYTATFPLNDGTNRNNAGVYFGFTSIQSLSGDSIFPESFNITAGTFFFKEMGPTGGNTADTIITRCKNQVLSSLSAFTLIKVNVQDYIEEKTEEDVNVYKAQISCVYTDTYQITASDGAQAEVARITAAIEEGKMVYFTGGYGNSGYFFCEANNSNWSAPSGKQKCAIFTQFRLNSAVLTICQVFVATDGTCTFSNKNISYDT